MTDHSDHFVTRLGARGSLLSRMQSQWVADQLEKLRPGIKVELQIIRTSGDRMRSQPLRDIGGKGLFTRELEEALLAGQIDMAVHSYKDVPVSMSPKAQQGLVVAAVPPREDVRDALIWRENGTLEQLPAGCRIGTSSLRRQAQILALRPDVQVCSIRGNIDSRIRKFRDGNYDAIILAMAGLRRSGLFDSREMVPIDMKEVLPAAGQGALMVQCRRDDQRMRDLLAVLDDPDVRFCVELERAIVARLGGDCHSPIAALARIEGGMVSLEAAVGRRNGRPPVLRASAQEPPAQALAAVEAVMRSLEDQGARQMLSEDQDDG